MSLEVIVNGWIYTIQPVGGAANILKETLPRICELDSSVNFTFLVEQSANLQNLPFHVHINLIRVPDYLDKFKPKLVWANLAMKAKNEQKKRLLGSTKEKILHLTYGDYISGWQGKVVLPMYDLIYEKWPRWFRDAAFILGQKRRAIQHADNILCISESTRQDLLTYYPFVEPAKTQVVYLAANPLFSRRTEFHHLKIDFPFILYIGGRHHYKGFDQLLRAFARWKERSETRLVVVGQIWQPAERQQIQQMGLEERVVLKTGISDEMLCDLYNQASAFVYPSLHEGFGIPLLEAMACGCPIVASDIPSTREIAQNIPFYFQSGDDDGLIDALSQAIHARTHERVNTDGVSRTNMFSWDKTARETLNCYRLLTSQN